MGELVKLWATKAGDRERCRGDSVFIKGSHDGDAEKD